MSTEILHVEPNARGGWSLRFEGEPAEAQVGNYATPEDAARAARMSCCQVQIRLPDVMKAGAPALPTKSPEARMAELLVPANFNPNNP